ncbi:MAG: peptidylprolyl isomerase, partial [Thermoguttaceae bacterium]
MNNVPALFVRLSAGILFVGMTLCAAQAETVVQVNLNGYVTGIFGDQVNNYQIQLLDNEAPITVANYLEYVNNSAYNNTIIHRSVSDFIIQGGGFKLQVNSNNVVTAITPIATYGTIENEFDSSRSNVRGTIAMAKLGGDPNSATSQWFVNLADNSSNLDNQNGGFTVFGQVAGEGMTLVDAVAGLTTYDLSTIYSNSALTDVPLAANGSIFVTVVSMNVVSTVAWKGGASSATTDWGTLANWGSGTSVPNGAGVNLSIGSQASTNNVIDLGSANRTVGNIYFTSSTGTTIQSTGGKSLILDNSGKTSLINVIGDHAISTSMVLNNNTLISIDGSLAISGAISGTGSLALNNTGTLTLSGSNSYTGKTLITSGMLTAGKAASLPGYNASGMITVSSGATLVVQAGASTGQWTAADIDTLRTYATFNS